MVDAIQSGVRGAKPSPGNAGGFGGPQVPMRQLRRLENGKHGGEQHTFTQVLAGVCVVSSSAGLATVSDRSFQIG